MLLLLKAEIFGKKCLVRKGKVDVGFLTSLFGGGEVTCVVLGAKKTTLFTAQPTPTAKNLESKVGKRVISRWKDDRKQQPNQEVAWKFYPSSGLFPTMKSPRFSTGSLHSSHHDLSYDHSLGLPHLLPILLSFP